MQASTVFQAASISKPVAAMVALRLVADGLDLDADVNRLLTSWQLPLDGRPPCNTPAVRRVGLPGREWRYSGGGYQVLQQLLEDVTGRVFADLAAELVLRPAGLATATYAQPDPADAAEPHIAGRREARMIYPEHAAAGLWCTPTDLLHLAQAIQSALAGEPGAILPLSSPGRW